MGQLSRDEVTGKATGIRTALPQTIGVKPEEPHAAKIPGGAYRAFGTLRLILALMVVAGHALLLGGKSFLELAPWGLGNIAVMTFFILSGFIIAESLDYFYRGRVTSFLINRALRIIPPFFVALLLSVAIHVWLYDRGTLVFFDYSEMPADIFSLKNFVANALSIVVLYGLGHVGLETEYPFVRFLWAVRVELHFYIAYAFVCWLQHGPAPRLRSLALPAAGVVSAALSVVAAYTGWGFLNYFFFAPFFILGVSLHKWINLQSNAAFWASIASAALVAYQYATYVMRSETAYVLGPLAVLFVLIGTIIILARIIPPQSVRRIDAWLGDLSYPIYLNHYAVLIAVLSTVQARNAWVFAFAMVASVIVSYLASLLTEPATRRLRNQIRGFQLR